MKPALQIRLNQTLALTPQLQQAIRLLQLSSMELELELNTAIESNPLLELEADREDVDTGEAETVDGVENAPETAAEAAESASSENDEGPLDLDIERSEYRGNNLDEDGLEPQDAEIEDLRDHLLWQ